jgi:hypothetical protein
MVRFILAIFVCAELAWGGLEKVASSFEKRATT